MGSNANYFEVVVVVDGVDIVALVLIFVAAHIGFKCGQ